jgi:sialidase-1
MVAGEGPGATQLSLDHPKFPGRLLFIGHKWSPSGNYTGPPDPFEYVWFSDDGGKTFGFSSSLGANLNEGTLVELDDGSILANIRPDSTSVSPTGARVTAVSTDGGSTFSTPKPDAALINGHCQATMLRASDERILFANPASSHGRCNGTLRISTTNAATWSQEIALGSSAVEAFGYSCLARLPGDSDSVGIIFETAAPGCDGVSCQLRFRTVALKTDELDATHTSSTAGN